MKKIISIIALTLAPVFGFAAGAAVNLDHVDLDLKDNGSLQRGAANYMNYCFGCHSLEYVRYNRIAKDLDITEELYSENLIFDESKFGSLMENAMVDSEAKKWFGATPPDLAMITRVKGGSDWLYSYLRGFYKDESRPWGVNNTIFKDVGMPHVLMELQGLCAEKPHAQSDVEHDALTGNEIVESGCSDYDVKGSLTAEEYEAFVYDLTNFLTYVGKPYRLEHEKLGWYVFAYLLVLLVFSSLYYRELWKDLH